jgi:hypothetical protein
MVVLTILMYPSFFNVYGPFKHAVWAQWLFSASLFVLATCSASTFFVFAQQELFGKKAGWKSLLYLPFLMALGVGVSLNNAKAVIEAIWSAIKRKPSEFVRTPKYGVTGQDKNGWHAQRVFTFDRISLPIIEIAFGCYMAGCLFISIYYGFGRASAPFLAIFAGGYFYVGCNSLYALYKMSCEAVEETGEETAEASIDVTSV